MHNLRVSSLFSYCTASSTSTISSSVPRLCSILLSYTSHKQIVFVFHCFPQVMATSSWQTRADRLLGKTAQAQVEEENSDGVAFWEKEIIDSQQWRHQIPKAVSIASSYESQDAQFPEEDRIQDQDQDQDQDQEEEFSNPCSASQTTAENNTSTSTRTEPEPEPIMYLPGGRRTGGIPATKLDININDEDYESDSEPVSSCHHLVGRFCIFSLVAKFPYKFMEDPENRVSRQFFASEKVYQRDWNMHYLFGPDSYSSKPLMLVPLGQVQKLIEEIGQQFQIDISVPDYPFQISFYNDGTPDPIPIGIVNSKADMADVQSKIPTIPEHFGSLPPKPTDSQVRDYDAWAEKMERAFEAERKKKSSMRKKRSERRKWLVREDVSSIQRAQRYLGLRPELSTAEAVHTNAPVEPNQSRDTQNAGTLAGTVDLTEVVPFPFEDDTVIISVDVESWESDHNIITEIGLSTLDTADIKMIAPGSQGEEWVKKIRSRHLRIKGRESLWNFKFCDSNPDMFQYGTSEFVTLEEAPNVVDSCFEHPYSFSFGCEGPPQTDDKGNLVPRASTTHGTGHTSGDDTSRTLLLVGHDISGDIAYLSSLGSSIFGTKSTSSPDGAPSRRHRVLSSIRERLDTAVFYKILNKDEQPRSLAKVCADLGIMTWFLHNAGNDARYTLEAFIKMVIKSRQLDDGVTTTTRDVNNLEEEKEQRSEAEMQAAKEAIVNEVSANQAVGTASGQTSNYTPFFRPELTTGNPDVGPTEYDDDDDDDDVDSGNSSLDEAPY